MASQMNPFEMLVGAENKLVSKKKKKQTTETAPAQNVGNGPSDAGHANGGKPASGGLVDVYEAVAIIERAAREARSIGDKCKLWKDWIRQASERSAKAIRYKDTDGSILEFRQVLLKSRALEISLEGAVGAGMTIDREEILSQLLLTFSSRFDARAAQSLASAIVRLSTLTEDEALDVKGAAQRAVYAVISSIKAASSDAAAGAEAAAVNSWVDQVSRLSQTIAKEQGMLHKLAAAGRGAATKEHAEIARKIFSLTASHFDLLQNDSLPSSGSGGADSYAPALDDLRSTISSKMQSAMGDKPKGGKGGDAGSKQAALASLRKEEAIVSQQVDSVAAQIRTLEAQLRTLRSQQQELDDKRTQLQQRMRLANDPQAQGKKGPAGVAHHQEELAVIDSMYSILLSTDTQSAGAGQIAAVQAQSQTVSSDFVAAGRQYLELAKAVMEGVPAKIESCKQRFARAEILLKLGSSNKSQGEADKITAETDKHLAETVKNAEDLVRTSVQVAGDLKARHDAVLRSLPDADSGVSEAMRAVDQLLREISAQYEAVQLQLRPPTPVAPAPVAAAPQSNGKHHAPPAAAAPRTAAPAPVARPASAAPTPAARPVPAAAAAPTAAAPQAPVAPAQPPPSAATTGGPKNAFDAAAAYLASARPLSAPVRSESPAAAPARKAAPAAPAPAAVKPTPAAASSSAPRQWGKPVAAGPAPASDGAASGDASLPTPAEALAAVKPAAPAAAAASADQEEGKAKKAKKDKRPKA